MSHNNQLLASKLCNHCLLSSITIMYLEAALSVNKHSPYQQRYKVKPGGRHRQLYTLWILVFNRREWLSCEFIYSSQQGPAPRCPDEETFGTPTCHYAKISTNVIRPLCIGKVWLVETRRISWDFIIACSLICFSVTHTILTGVVCCCFARTHLHTRTYTQWGWQMHGFTQKKEMRVRVSEREREGEIW